MGCSGAGERRGAQEPWASGLGLLLGAAWPGTGLTAAATVPAQAVSVPSDLEPELHIQGQNVVGQQAVHRLSEHRLGLGHSLPL